jgi:predicted ATP-grasp superfamily ATP-dependent carboligase
VDADPVDIDEVLTIEVDGLGQLRAPVMVLALRGWFDVAGAATTAIDGLAPHGAAVTVAEIDPDPFYDFTQERPSIEIVDGEIRLIGWPENRFDVFRGAGSRDLVLLVGTEPHVYWRTYARCITAVTERLGCEAVVTVGAAAEQFPHTRTPLVTGSTTNARLARELGLAAPTYQGMTGLAGVLQAELERLDVPAISLRVGIPHYLMNAEHPQAVAALQAHLGHVLGVSVGDDLSDEIARWRTLHDEVVDGDAQLTSYVRLLEREYDRRAEAAIPSADDLGARFEEFLRDERGEQET